MRDRAGTTRAPGAVNLNLAGGAFVMLVAAAGWFGGGAGDYAIWVFPRSISVVMAGLALVLLARARYVPEILPLFGDKRAAAAVGLFLVGAWAYVILMLWGGFWLSSAVLYGAASFALRQQRGWAAAGSSALAGVLVSGAMYFLFRVVLAVPLPGIWWVARG